MHLQLPHLRQGVVEMQSGVALALLELQNSFPLPKQMIGDTLEGMLLRTALLPALRMLGLPEEVNS